MEPTKQEAAERASVENSKHEHSIRQGLVEAAKATILLNDVPRDTQIPARPIKQKGDNAYFVK